MKIHVLLVMAFTMSFSQFALSVNESGTFEGNGGDVVVCSNTDGSKIVTMLDFYENNFNPELGSKGDSVEKKVSIALKRIKKISPKRYEKFVKYAYNFINESIFTSNATLPDVLDSGEINLPSNCHLDQVAIRLYTDASREPKYIVNKQLWDVMDNDSKAGLVLHEVIYNEAIEMDQKNSIATREFNRLISSRAIENLEQNEFIKFLIVNRFGAFEIDGRSYWSCNRTDLCNEKMQHTSSESEIFYPNGQIKTLTLGVDFGDTVLLKDITLSYLEESYYDSRQTAFFSMFFYENGNYSSVERVDFMGIGEITYPDFYVRGINIKRKGQATYYEDGSIKTLHLDNSSEDGILVSIRGNRDPICVTLKRYNSGGYAEMYLFDKDGYLTEKDVRGNDFIERVELSSNCL